MKHLWKFIGIAKRDLIVAIVSVVVVASLIPIFTYIYFANAIQNKDTLMNRNNTGLVLLDRNNKPFFTFYQAKTMDEVPLSDIPKITQQTVIASEDKDFYTNPGFSVRSIIRSMITDIKTGDVSQGGSTITQQLVKYSLLNSQKSFLRKFQEIVLAAEIGRRYSKNDILSMYLNSAYFGKGGFGIEDATQAYFGKHAKDLDLAQSSFLVGLLPSPSLLSGDQADTAANLSQAKELQKQVLDKMVAQNIITPDQEQTAFDQKLTFKNTEDTINNIAPHFAIMVRDQLIAQYGEEEVARSGFKVKTTLDLDWQKYAEQQVAQQVANLKNDRVSNGAAVVEDPATGEIRALVGSVNWNNSQFGKYNIATANRQPGSSFKPIVYIAALEQHLITPETILQDVPTAFKVPGSPDYKPQDYDHKYRGPVTVRRALVNSLNIPAVEVLEKVGVPSAVEMGQRLGLTTLQDPSQYGPSLVLGVADVKLLELTNVYATFANNGMKNTPTLIDQIVDKDNNVIYQYQPQPQRVIDPEYTFLISSILSDNATRAEEFGNTLNIPRQAAVKTGTTEDYRDAWTMGYTPQLAVGVWVGNNDGTLMDQIAGSLGAAPIWKNLMTHFLEGVPEQKFTPPPGIVTQQVCSGGISASTAGVKEASRSARIDFFAEGTEPVSKCGKPKDSFNSSVNILPYPGAMPSPGSLSSPSPNSDNVVNIGGNDQNQTSPDQGQYQTGGWYPVGPGGQALQYWNGQWYNSPQQDKHQKDKH